MKIDWFKIFTSTQPVVAITVIKAVAVGSILWSAPSLYAAACCAGGGARSFLSLQQLQTYEIGFSTSFRNVSGLYEYDGSVIGSAKNQTTQLSLGAAARLAEDLEAFVVVPTTYQEQKVGEKLVTTSGIGDIQLGASYQLIESFLGDEWYPNVSLLAGVKLPTGKTRPLLIGNGIWEPSFGAQAQKSFGDFLATVTASFVYRVEKSTQDFTGTPIKLKEGNRFDLTGSVGYSLTRRLSASAGISRQWDSSTLVNGEKARNADASATNLLLSTSYFLTRFWSIGANYEQSIGLAGAGHNSQVFRSFALNSTYGFY